MKSFIVLSMQQLKNGFFDEPQIRKPVQDENFSGSLNMDKLVTWFAFVQAVENILGNHKAENYRKIVRNMLEELKHFGVNMEIHILYSHLDSFLENLQEC